VRSQLQYAFHESYLCEVAWKIRAYSQFSMLGAEQDFDNASYPTQRDVGVMLI